eukprot:5649713-Pleurochrysis_carterae.AAC.1
MCIRDSGSVSSPWLRPIDCRVVRPCVARLRARTCTVKDRACPKWLNRTFNKMHSSLFDINKRALISVLQQNLLNVFERSPGTARARTANGTRHSTRRVWLRYPKFVKSRGCKHYSAQRAASPTRCGGAWATTSRPSKERQAQLICLAESVCSSST